MLFPFSAWVNLGFSIEDLLLVSWLTMASTAIGVSRRIS
jgi:hypothetical protein